MKKENVKFNIVNVTEIDPEATYIVAVDHRYVRDIGQFADSTRPYIKKGCLVVVEDIDKAFKFIKIPKEIDAQEKSKS